MLIELMGRDDEAGARLPYLAPGRRVQVDEMDVTIARGRGGLPLPLLIVEDARRHLVKQVILAGRVHLPRCRSPPGAGRSSRRYHKSPWLGAQRHFFRQLGLLKHRLGDADSLRVP